MVPPTRFSCPAEQPTEMDVALRVCEHLEQSVPEPLAAVHPADVAGQSYPLAGATNKKHTAKTTAARAEIRA
ncbi:MAG: hypothetical protein FWG39_02880 [Alphaproteobacteria bacterium]|nr:hypothetical protein [Alphaproteobacteria bacterium]